MSCSTCPPESCYNGCPEIVSDQCVRYTGEDSLSLNIHKNDSLLTVETALINAVVSFLDGTGISISINPSYYCTLVSSYLPEGTPTAKDLFTALVKAACDLQGQINTINNTLNSLESPYTVECLTDVTSSSSTHDIVQAVITKLCSTSASLSALSLDVSTNYVKIADFNSLVAAYLSGIAGPTQQYLKMIPYSVVEYYGPLSNFDGTGAGIPSLGWANIYLCNGLNGTPDKRGRVAVGAINNIQGDAPLDAAVNPAANPANPNYSILDIAGANSTTLSISQIPSHTHGATATAVDNGHVHAFTAIARSLGETGVGSLVGGQTAVPPVNDGSYTGTTETGNADITVEVSVANNGGSQPHLNIQPVLACYYIMHIPAP